MEIDPSDIRKGAEVEASIESLAFGGKAVARPGGFVVFVEGALPGERVLLRVTRRKGRYAEGVVLKILQPSPQRVTPRCPLFGDCGGCRLQQFAYEGQLEQKERQVADALGHIAGQSGFRLHPIAPSPDQWRYRNKMEFSFGLTPAGSIAVGLHRAGEWSRILDIPDCFIAPEVLNRAVAFARAELNRLAASGEALISVYDQRIHRGFLRHLVLRHSTSSGQFVAALLTNEKKWPGARAFGEALLAANPACRGFVWGTTRALNDVARPERICLELGEPWIEERLGRLSYRVSAFSFFQTNTRGAEVLYARVREAAELGGTERVLDAYCGTGSIGLFVADTAASVTGIEIVEEAVRDARENAAANGIGNCEFRCGDMRDELERLAAEGAAPFDRVILDPPRGGMDKKALRLLIGLRAPLVVYVSCNPATLARDAPRRSRTLATTPRTRGRLICSPTRPTSKPW